MSNTTERMCMVLDFTYISCVKERKPLFKLKVLGISKVSVVFPPLLAAVTMRISPLRDNKGYSILFYSILMLVFNPSCSRFISAVCPRGVSIPWKEIIEHHNSEHRWWCKPGPKVTLMLEKQLVTERYLNLILKLAGGALIGVSGQDSGCQAI